MGSSRCVGSIDEAVSGPPAAVLMRLPQSVESIDG